MSAKGRKAVPDAPFEYYPTPLDVVYSLIESPLVDLPGGLWLDPCAGRGRIPRAVNAKRSDVRWTMIEINPSHYDALSELARPNVDAFLIRDFFEIGDEEAADAPRASVAIMNPPFSHTLRMVRRCLEIADWCVMLQRQGWFGTKQRSPWLRDHCPDVLQLPWRPSFRPDGATDSADYCWYIWPPGSLDGRRFGRVAMLEKPESGQKELFQ